MEICAQVDAEQELVKGTNYWIVIKDIATIPSNTRRFFLATTLFLFHKFTGTDSLNYFAPEIFQMIGVPAGSLSLLTTGVVSKPILISYDGLLVPINCGLYFELLPILSVL